MEQEEFWKGNFGDNYHDRFSDAQYVPANVNLFSKILSRTTGINSVLEFGAGSGFNLQAIRTLVPHVLTEGVEINEKAASRLKGVAIAHNVSALDFQSEKKWDFVLTKLFLIHVAPENLDAVYEKIVNYSSKYVCIAEYYNPTPVSVVYRGHANKLFKRNFAGELMDRHGLKLVDYGFQYHRGSFPHDDLTWFLMEKQ